MIDLQSNDLVVNNRFDGITETKMLRSSDSSNVIPNGSTPKVVKLIIKIKPSETKSFNNNSTVTGRGETGLSVIDTSNDGIDPDQTITGPSGNNNDGLPGNNQEPTPLIYGPEVYILPIAEMSVNGNNYPDLRWRSLWTNTSGFNGLAARISNPIPEHTTYSGKLTCSPAAQTTKCYYEPPSMAYPRGRVIWEGHMSANLESSELHNGSYSKSFIRGANLYRSQILIYFNSKLDPGYYKADNQATIEVNQSNLGDFDANVIKIDVTANVSFEISFQDAAKLLAQNDTNKLPKTGHTLSTWQDNVGTIYSTSKDLTLEISKLGIDTSIVGVPYKDGNWDVTWLGSNVGYLNGTSFPTLPGNSVLTGHVSTVFGTKGIFYNLKDLVYDDMIVIHAFGNRYTYKVRSSHIINPADTQVMSNLKGTWITLITCQHYDPLKMIYDHRLAVQAVLVDVSEE